MPETMQNDNLLYRSFQVRAADVNYDRSVSLSFSSEEPVLRYFRGEAIYEVLDHSKESVDLTRLERKAPFLMDHNPYDQRGVVESVSIGADRRGLAVVRFGKSAQASELLDDIRDEIRPNISFGYELFDGRQVGERDGIPVWRFSWRPYEISSVSIPADTTVGVGRQFEKIVSIEESRSLSPEAKSIEPAQPITKETRTMSEEKKVETVVDNGPAEAKRAAEITALADQHDVPLKDVREFITGGKSVEQFQRHILEQQRAKIVSADKPTEISMSAKEVQRYSLMRAINAAATGDWSKAGFERECSLAVAEKLGRDAKGFFVPLNVQQRTLTAGTSTTGAELVGTDHLAGSFIDALIAESVMGKLGATYLPGLVGDVDIPAMGAGTFYWLTEGGDVTDSTPATRSVALSSKTVAGSVPMSRRFVKQSAPAAEMIVERILRRGAAAAIDSGIIQGTGLTGQPTGITATTGVNTETITVAGQPTFANLVNMETAVAADEALAGRLSYLMAHGVKGHCKTTSIDSGSGIMIWSGNEVNGYQAMASNLVPANGIIFGNFEDVYVGLWGVLDIMADVATNAASGGLVLRVFQDVDCGVGNAVSFCINA